MGKNEFFGDGAVDIIAKYFTMEVYIQCKCLASRVGPKIVRELNGIKDGKIACIVSKNGFSNTAIREANQYNIILSNENDVCEKLIDYYNNIKNNNKIEYVIEYIENFTINNNNFIMSGVKNCTIIYN